MFVGYKQLSAHLIFTIYIYIYIYSDSSQIGQETKKNHIIEDQLLNKSMSKNGQIVKIN